MSIDLDFIKKTEELLKKQEEHLEELKLLNETLENCKFDSSFIDEFLEKHEEELEKFVSILTDEFLEEQEEHLEEFVSIFIDKFLEKYEEELEEFKNLPLDEKVRMLEERNSEKAE